LIDCLYTGYLGDSFYRSKDPTKQYQSTEGRKLESKENPEKANNTKYGNTIKRHIQKTQHVP